MQITKRSALTEIEHTREIAMTPEQLDRYYAGDELIGEIFPDLGTDDREFLISGITPQEWIAVFGQEDYDLDGQGEAWKPGTKDEFDAALEALRDCE